MRTRVLSALALTLLLLAMVAGASADSDRSTLLQLGDGVYRLEGAAPLDVSDFGGQ